MEDFWCLDEGVIVIFSLMTLDERSLLSSSVLLKYMEINCVEIEHEAETGQKEALNNKKTHLQKTERKKNLCMTLPHVIWNSFSAVTQSVCLTL